MSSTEVQKAPSASADWSHRYKGDARPDKDFIEAAVHAVVFNIMAPSDTQREKESLRDTVRVGCFFRHPDCFTPPKKILDPAKRISREARVFWCEAADMLLLKAQREVFAQGVIGELRRKYNLGIIEIYVREAIFNKQHNLYFNYDPSGVPDQDFIDQIKAFEKDIRDRFKKAIERIMSDREVVEEIHGIAARHARIVREIVFKEHAEYLDHVRDQIEDPGQREMFVQVLRNAVLKLGIEDLDVTTLSSTDAVAYGCKGLYSSPGVRSVKGEIAIPMSVYGTTDLREWDDVLDIAAHEIAHHLIQTGRFEKKGKYVFLIVNLNGREIKLLLSKGANSSSESRVLDWDKSKNDHNFFHQITTGLVRSALCSQGIEDWKRAVSGEMEAKPGSSGPDHSGEVSVVTDLAERVSVLEKKASAPAPTPAPAAGLERRVGVLEAYEKRRIEDAKATVGDRIKNWLAGK